MLFTNPVRGTIHPASWVRPAGNHDFVMNQDFGPGIPAEPKVIWPGGEGIAKGTYKDFHQGIDLYNGRGGDDVLAAAAGRVDFAGVDGTGNRVVIVNHGGGWRTWYGHLASEIVSVGQAVKAAQKTSTVGKSGGATGYHLHWGVEWSGFPGDVIAIRIVNGHESRSTFKFIDPARRLIQNVTIHPLADDGIRIRTASNTAGTPYAQTKAGRIVRLEGGIDLGPTSEWRDWGGSEIGGSYTVDGHTGSIWDRIQLPDGYRYIARPLAVLSQK